MSAARKLGDMLGAEVTQGARTELTSHRIERLAIPSATATHYRNLARCPDEKVDVYREATRRRHFANRNHASPRYRRGTAGQGSAARASRSPRLLRRSSLESNRTLEKKTPPKQSPCRCARVAGLPFVTFRHSSTDAVQSSEAPPRELCRD